MPAVGMDIFGYGITTVDDVVIVETFPRPNSKQPVLEKVRQGGGLTASALVAAARLGCRCALAIALGQDELSRFTRETLGRNGITLLESSGGGEVEPFHSFIVTERVSGERSILWDGSKSVPPEVGEREMRLAEEAGCFFTDHIYAASAIPLARRAREAGTPVVGDFERRDEAVLELMALTDHIILPLAFAVQAAGESSPEGVVTALLRQPGRRVVCVTDSERGCWWGEADSPGAVRHQPAFRCETVVDTTGCGDVFHGVYAAGLVLGYSAGERIRRAAAAACLKAGKVGAQAGAPTASELEAFLAQNR